MSALGWAGLGADIGSSALSFAGGLMSNSANKKMAREQMAFQERMASTQYQRGMKDMKAAGLNPILAYKGGSNTAPTGASIAQQNPFQGADVGKAAKNYATNKLLQAQTEQAEYQRDITKNEWHASATSAYEAIMKKKLLRDPDFYNSWKIGQYGLALSPAVGAASSGISAARQLFGLPPARGITGGNPTRTFGPRIRKKR